MSEIATVNDVNNKCIGSIPVLSDSGNRCVTKSEIDETGLVGTTNVYSNPNECVKIEDLVYKTKQILVQVNRGANIINVDYVNFSDIVTISPGKNDYNKNVTFKHSTNDKTFQISVGKFDKNRTVRVRLYSDSILLVDTSQKNKEVVIKVVNKWNYVVNQLTKILINID